MGLESLCVNVKVKGDLKEWRKYFEKPNGGIILVNGQDKILDTLGELTNDELGKAPANQLEGTSYVIIKEFNVKNSNKEFPLGTELIRKLIQQEGSDKTDKTVKISIVTGENCCTYPDKKDQTNAENGIWANAFVKFNPSEKVDFLVEGAGTGKCFWEKLIPHIVLAHELIHAYHIVNGISEPDEIVRYTYYYPDKTERTENVNKEELYTMGVPGYEREEAITENKIRKEPKKNIRIAYWIDD